MLVVLLTLVAHDLFLKSEYSSGKYKDPYQTYSTLNWKDFDIVDLDGSTAANVQFVQGPFSVRIENNALDYVFIRQQGNHLKIEAVFPGNYRFNPNPYILVISCPRLSNIFVNATYRANGHEVTDTIVREDWHKRQVLIDGFQQDTLSVVQDYGSTVVLANNHIRSFRASAGKSKGAGSKLILQQSNIFEEADLDIDQKSKLELENALIHSLSYHLADSAQLIVNGNAQSLLHNSKTHQ